MAGWPTAQYPQLQQHLDEHRMPDNPKVILSAFADEAANAAMHALLGEILEIWRAERAEREAEAARETADT